VIFYFWALTALLAIARVGRCKARPHRLEPLEDMASFTDTELDRSAEPTGANAAD
jgi:hypothetical protein